MYCPKCGKAADASVRFCPGCGAQIGSGFVPPESAYPGSAYPGSAYAGSAYATGGYPQSKLVRPRYPRMIAGVCSAFALQYGWDLTLVRVLTAIAAVFTSGGVGLAYLVAWVLIPEAPFALPPQGVSYVGATPPPGYGAPPPVAPGDSTGNPSV